MNEPAKWRVIGPGGAGSHYIPTISPHDPETVLTCSDMTGAYISHDGGNTWRQFNLRTRVDSYAFDPSKPGVIYAGSSGLFRSEDNGKTWKLILPVPESVIEEIKVGDEADNRYITNDDWPGGKVQAVFVDPEQSAHIYAGVNTRATLIDARSKGSPGSLTVFHSPDSGKTWSRLVTMAGGRVFGFFVDTDTPPNNRTLYIFTSEGIYRGSVSGKNFELLGLPGGAEQISYAAWAINRESKNPVFYITTATDTDGERILPGFWKSADKGVSWERKTEGIAAVTEHNGVTETVRCGHIGTCTGDSSVVYLTVRYHASKGGSGTFGIYKSEDEGESWKPVFMANKFKNAENHRTGWVERLYTHEYTGTGPKGVGFIGIGVCATNPDICYVTDMGAIHRTVDGGRTWEQVYSRDYPDGSFSNRGEMDVTTCYGVHFDPFDNNHIIISYTDMGMARSRNGGESWFHAIKGVPVKWSNTCYWMVFDPEVRGRAWSAWGYAHDLPRAKMYDSMDWLRNSPGGVCRTENGAESWEVSNEGMPHGPVTHIILDPASPAGKRTLYAAVFGHGVYKSTDDGYTWVQKNNGLEPSPNAYRFAQLPDGTLYLVVARAKKDGKEYGGAIYKSVDGAETWEKINLPDGVNAPNDLTFDPVNPRRMYLACWPRTINGREYYGGAYVTADGGNTWNCIFDQSSHVYSVTVDAYDSNVLYLVTFESSAYRSDDRGRTWRRLGGYNFKWGHRVVNDPVNKDMIYITTFGSSIWHGPANGTGDPLDEIG